MNLESPAAFPAFKAGVEAHVFVTDRGAQYCGCAEYAPFQKVPEQKVKRDPREGTLEAGARSCPWEMLALPPTACMVLPG